MPPTLQHNPAIPLPQDPVQQGTMYQGRGGEQDVLDSTQPVRVRLPDLSESTDHVSDSEETAVVSETAEHRHRQHRRLARFLPGNRSQMVSLFTIGALLAGGAFLLAMTLRGNGASNPPQLDDTPAGWAQAVPPVEWNNQVFEQPRLITEKNPRADEQSSNVQTVDQQPLFSSWPRVTRKIQRSGPGSTVAAANSSARLARSPTPDAPDSVSPPAYPQGAYPRRERVARLTGTIETTIEKPRRR